MRVNLLRHNSIIGLAALALPVLYFAEQSIGAQVPVGMAATRVEPDGVTAILHTTSWGMVRGQTTRVSVVNLNEPPVSEQQRRMVFVQVTLFDASGVVIAESDEIAIPPGESRSVDFNRDTLSVAGDDSGRLQVRAQVRYRPFPIVDRSQLTLWPTSTQLIDNITGRTEAVWVTTGFFEVVRPPRNSQ